MNIEKDFVVTFSQACSKLERVHDGLGDNHD